MPQLPAPLGPATALATTTARSPVDQRSSPSGDRRARVRRWWRRKPLNRALVLLHRWPGLVLGLLLTVECTSGAVLLYHGEIFRATNSELYHHSASANPVAPERAIEIVAAAHPGFDAIWVGRDHGVLVVGDVNYKTLWFVDPGTGHINGHGNMDQGILGLLVNVHDCALSCEGYPGYTHWLAVPIWKSGPSFLTGITRGGMLVGVVGLLMILLVLTSLKIWWPGRKRIRQRFVVRRGRGRFARDYDLHNVIGAIALPFLLMWGITGAAFEFPGVENGWIALTGGDKPKVETYSVTPNKAAAKDPQLTVEQASAIATAKVPGSVRWIGVPTKDAPYYEIDVKSRYGSSAYRAVYSGDAYVYLDAHDASNVKVINNGDGPLANRFYDKYLEPTHFGWNVNGWWRSIWAALGLAPLALMITGVSTWLFRRGVRTRRARARRATP